MYDLRTISNRVGLVRRQFPEFKIKYSLKANSFGLVLNHLANIVDGFDVSTWNEYEAAEGRVVRERISITGPAKNPDMLQVISLASEAPLIHVESPREFYLLEELARGRKTPLKIALRIAPPLSVSGGQTMTRFGLEVNEAHELLDEITSSLQVVGLQCYPGTQNLSSKSVVQDLGAILGHIGGLLERLSDIEYLSLGGGCGVPYFKGETELDLADVGREYQEAREWANQRFGIDPQWYLELGRYLVADAGRYECTVVDKRFRGDQIFLVVDGGMHHFSAASGNFGQLYQKNYPITTSSTHESSSVYQIVGSLCTPMDVLGRDVTLSRTSVGDTITIWKAGAYGYEASPHQFLLNEPPERVVQ